ncbi:MAG: UDP-N-acetylmuramate--L-alanine ligase [Clostridia bacterium]|nr:UDP-N-acetylmuramate--L-alanine ligase [Clostridia bacterium]
MNFEETYAALENAKKLFFVGIGGISMSSIAFVFSSKGYDVSGSDRAESDMTRKLAAAGIRVFRGHDGANVAGADAVIYTGAVNMQNPEIAEAKKQGIPIIYRADALGYMMKKYKTRIGVSGSHGKSTCTAMISHVLIAAGADPTVMCGAETAEMGGAYRVGEKKDFVFEACEYKDSFLGFFPSVSVVLNIDLDHTDYFTGGLEQIKASFRKYAMLALAEQSGAAVANADDENTVSALAGLPCVTFGVKNEADFRAENISYAGGYAEFDIVKRGARFCRVCMSIPGEHNVYNALACAAACDLAGVSPEDIGRYISDFTGLSRRFEKKGSVGGADVYIDYAHHPRELRAAVAAARGLCRGRLVCVFEPHTYSRTHSLFSEFAASFGGADRVIFTDIYAAREVNTYGVSSVQLAKAVAGGEYARSYADAAEKIRADVKEGDLVLVLGAGTVTEVAALLTSE